MCTDTKCQGDKCPCPHKCLFQAKIPLISWWNKSDRERYLSVIIYEWNLQSKTNERIEQNKNTHRHREQTSGYQWGKGSREGQVRGRRLRGTNYSAYSKQATKIYCTAQGMKPAVCNNYKLSIVFKNCESLSCTAKT